MSLSPARRTAFEILRRVEEDRGYAAVLLASRAPGMKDADRGLCHELVLGVLRNQLWLDRVIAYCARRNLDRIDLAVKVALRLAIYQLRFLSRIPPSAAVNESVNLVRAAGLNSAAAFANAVLRRATREPDYDPVQEATDDVEKLAIETSHPRWLLERWIGALGPEETAELARANNKPPALVFRFTQKSAGRALLSELLENRANVTASKVALKGWRISAFTDQIRQCVLEGLIYFQDEASQLVANLACAQAGEQILDVCAAPGSKATQIAGCAADLMVVAGDLYEHRVRTMRELATHQAAELHFVVYDAQSPLPFADESFDRVLVDAPCSGTGTLRHNPEIRWRLKPADISALTAKQSRILRNAAMMVRSGGHLLYATCSLEPEENERVVSDFLKRNGSFVLKSFDESMKFRTAEGALRTWPHRDDTDGFFLVVFQRNGRDGNNKVTGRKNSAEMGAS